MKWMITISSAAFLLFGCLDDVGFFFAYNINDLEETAGSGGVIIIGVSDEDAEGAELVSGTLPVGLSLKPDGTVQGVPEETGLFEFSVETFMSDGSSTLQKYVVEIADDQASP